MPLQVPANLIVIVADPGSLFGSSQKQKTGGLNRAGRHYENVRRDFDEAVWWCTCTDPNDP